MAHHIDGGYDRPMHRSPYSTPFSVATCTFQVDTGNSGGSGRSVMRRTEAPSSSSAAAAGR